MCQGWLSWWWSAEARWSWWWVAGHSASNGPRVSHRVRRLTAPGPRFRPPPKHPRRPARELSIKRPAGDGESEFAGDGVGAVDEDVPTANRGRSVSRRARTWSDAIVGPPSRQRPLGRQTLTISPGPWTRD